MTPNKKLNYVLHKWDNVPAWRWGGLKEHMASDENIPNGDGTHHELFSIIEKLIRDKYIEAVEDIQYNKVYVTSREIEDGTYLRRNFDGTVFIKDGGYVRRHNWNFTKQVATVTNIVLLLVIGYFQIRGCGSSSSNNAVPATDTTRLTIEQKEDTRPIPSIDSPKQVDKIGRDTTSQTFKALDIRKPD